MPPEAEEEALVGRETKSSELLHARVRSVRATNGMSRGNGGIR